LALAFGKIVNSLVEDIINPIIGLALGNVDFSELKVVLKEAVDGQAEVAIRYGNFLNQVIQFVILAWVVFLIIKAANRMRLSNSLAPKE